MLDLLRLLIEKLGDDQNALDRVKKYVFSKPHWNLPEHQVLKHSLSMTDQMDRSDYLNHHLGAARLADRQGIPEHCKALLNAAKPSP